MSFLKQHDSQHSSTEASAQGLPPLGHYVLQGSNVDLMQLHMYPDSWLRCNEDCKRDWTIRWVFSHKLTSGTNL